MLPTHDLLRKQLLRIVADKRNQGHLVDGLEGEIAALPDSYDAMDALARRLPALPMRSDWPYVEPNDLEAILAECDPKRPLGPIRPVDPVSIAPKVEAAFLGSVCGCILGKPLEVSPDLAQIRKAAEQAGEWPLNDYVSENLLRAMIRRHHSWPETTRGRIDYVAADDDINYTVAGMELLETHGRDFTRKHIADYWIRNLPIAACFGPERTVNIKAGLRSMGGGPDHPFSEWVEMWNPGDEFCGALIRADAYGYACPGHPALAAELAWRDAGFTHRRTGLYGTMFAAAAIATAFVAMDPLEIFEVALGFVPRRSRFHAVVSDSLEMVRGASDWLDGYGRIHGKYGEYGHCMVYQEVGTLINTLRFAKDVGEGICIQVSQGNDTDSFGATCGSILGAYFGPGHLEPRWLAPFNNTIHTTLAEFHEQKLSEVARRMGRLPGRLAEAAPKQDGVKSPLRANADAGHGG